MEYLEIKSDEKAIENFDKSIEINDEYIDAYFNRAIAKTFLKKFEEAILDYNKVTVRLISHDVGRVTERDKDMTNLIDKLFNQKL